MLLTAAIVAFYIADRNLYFAYAGHPPALVKRKAERFWFDATIDRSPEAYPGVTNVPLAITADAIFEQQTFSMAPGDRVFLYTDGVTEAPDEKGNAFGVARLKALLEAHGSDSLSELKIAVVDALRRHTGGELRHDDVTLLAIEIR